MSIYYDVCPYKVFDINNEDTEKNQVIIYEIKNYIHQPLASFCLEDVLNMPDGPVIEECELYIDGIEINKIAHQLYISIPIPDISGILSVLIFQDKKIEKLKKSKFNNYNYIEKTIIDEVEEHQNILKQLVSEVKRILDHLSS